MGLFLNENFWDKGVWDLQKTDSAIKNQIEWYEKAYKEVVEEVGNHPAVMGFYHQQRNRWIGHHVSGPGKSQIFLVSDEDYLFQNQRDGPGQAGWSSIPPGQQACLGSAE